jgi:osmotically-inducible protein OsmY
MTATHRGGRDDTGMKHTFLAIALVGSLTAGALAAQDTTEEVEAAEARVNAALAASDVADVRVARHASSLVLSGEVENEVARAEAEKIAGEAAKDVRVTSHIKVREDAGAAGGTPAPVDVTRQIEEALRTDPRTASLGVTVSMDEQRVIGLHGLVPSQSSRWDAELVARGAAGRLAVRNHLQIPAAE